MKTKVYAESLKTCSQTCACDPCDLYGDQALSLSLVLKILNKKDFKDFEAVTEKTQTFSSSELVTFSSEQKVILRKPAATLF